MMIAYPSCGWVGGWADQRPTRWSNRKSNCIVAHAVSAPREYQCHVLWTCNHNFNFRIGIRCGCMQTARASRQLLTDQCTEIVHWNPLKLSTEIALWNCTLHHKCKNIRASPVFVSSFSFYKYKKRNAFFDLIGSYKNQPLCMQSNRKQDFIKCDRLSRKVS